MAAGLIGAIAGAGSFVLDAVKCLAAPIGRPFNYLYKYDTNLRNLEKEVRTLKNTNDDVQVKVTAAEVNVEEIKQSVKDWQTTVNNTITEAGRLIQEKEKNSRCFKGLCPNCIVRYQKSKAASELMEDKIDPLLQQEVKFDRVSYPTIPLEKNFDKLRDDVSKLTNARRKVQRKVEEAKNNEEEIEEDVKKWLEDVDSIIVKADDLIKNQSSIGTDRKTRYQKSKATSELIEDKIDPLPQQEVKFDRVSYPTIPLEKNFDKLRDDVSKLTNARRKVQRKVKEAKNNVEEIEEDVKKWLEDVDSVIDEAEKLIEDQSSIGTDWLTRYQKSKAASELMEDKIDPLLQQEKSFKEVSHPTIHKETWLRSNEDYLAFESRNSTVKNVWDALQDEEIYMVGVYGMGGLGKTTLVQEIGRIAEKDKLFDEIVFVEVTETLDVKRIQTEIADKLGVKFNNESERKNKLYDRLRNDKKTLLTLDNVWEDLDLTTVGIPLGVNRGGCKLLLTTRNLDVLDKMGSISNFGMNVLNQEEAWNLFQKMAGNVIQTRELNSLPNDVCKECGGSPIVIATVARALRNKRHQFEWEDALRELRAPSPTKFMGCLEKEYQKIALSYKYLRDELKKTFLISSLMKNNTSISDLFKHIVSLDILEGDNLTMEKARNRLDKVVRELKYSCLLLHGFTDRQFSMHDVIRAIAITIAFTDHHVFTERNDVERVWKNKDKLRKCTGISLHGSSISQLWHKDLDCLDLEFFYMNGMWDSSFEILEDFFIVMPKLKDLNLFNMQQSSLPSSLDLLTNLQTLCLDWSHIESVAIIGKLEKLKVLSLQHLDIKNLPTEIGQLTQLKLFDLSNCWSLKIIVPNVISKLLQLEEFYVRGCPIQWKVEVLEELKLLSRLACLELDIDDSKMLPKDFFSKELKRYKISIGNWPSLYFENNEYKGVRMFKLNLNSTISLEEFQGIKNVEILFLSEFSDAENSFNEFITLTPLLNEKVIFTNLMALELQYISSRKIWDIQFPTLMPSSYQNLTRLTLLRCRKIKYAFPFCIAKSLQSLQHLEIKYCDILEVIVAEEEGAEAIVSFAFPQLIFLVLENLPKLTTVYHGVDTWELPMLKRLVVKGCEKFTSKYLTLHENSLHTSEPKSFGLDNKINSDLEEFELRNGRKEIIWHSHVLKINHDLSTNFPHGLLQRWENSKELQLYGNEYKKLFFPNLPNLEVLSVKWCSKLMSIVSSSTSFQNLKILRIEGCKVLMKLITYSTARSLVQLKEMGIENCEMLIEIVENERDATTSTKIVFDNLKTLSLWQLDSLTCFSSGNYSFNFPSLEDLYIRNCPNMKTFSQGILNTPKLHKVNNESWNEGNDLNKTIQGAYKKQDISLELKLLTFQDDNSIELCYKQHPNSFYQNLTDLILSSCGNIKYAFPSSIAKSLHRLQHLKIHNCKSLKEIVGKKEGANEDDKFVFLHVTSLKLENLPEFIAFYHTFEWPMLKELVVNYCGKFMTSKYMSFQENNKEGELHFSEPKSVFLNDKINHDLEVLESKNDHAKISWQSQSKALKIRYDNSANISLGLLQNFQNLKELKLYDNKYKELFFPNLPNLEVVDVEDCSKLTSLVSSSASFQNLEVLSVNNCNGLIKLITPSITRSLLQLRVMNIYDCEMLIEIVENEGDATTGTEFFFNNLKTLSLEGLESLTCFCYGNYSFNFPSLEELIIRECPNMKTFSQGILSTPMLQKVNYEIFNETKEDWETMHVENEGNDLNKTIQKQVDFNVRELTLIGREIMSIREGEIQENFDKVEILQLIKDEYANIPIQILQEFNNLETLILKVSSYEEIFSFGEDKEHTGAFTKLKDLELHGLFNLKCIWKQDFRLNSVLQNLDRLVVQYCPSLTVLLPSLASFENITSLWVRYCNGMQNLMSSSTAKSLVRLEELTIVGCEMMTEVLANEGDIEKAEIVFKKLRNLHFRNLESLTCFCSGNYTLEFPFLENLFVSKCLKMKTFSGGGLSMPRLKYLNFKDCSKSDIDTIIKQLQNDCSEFINTYKNMW